MKTFHCDRCGATLARERHTVGFRMADINYTGDLGRLAGYDLAADLCSRCHDAARLALTAFVADGQGGASGSQVATGANVNGTGSPQIKTA